MKPVTPDMARDTAATPLDAVMHAAADAIIIIDCDGLIERFNPAAETMFGYRESDVVGKSVSLLMGSGDRDWRDGDRSTGGAALSERVRQETGRRQDGETFPMMLSVGEILQQGGSRFVGIIRDLTEQQRTAERLRRLEEQLLHADRLVILGELTAGIAHEINQPLTAIAAYADAGGRLLKRSGAESGEDMKLVCDRISGQARRAAEVVHRLRGLVRGGTSSRASHDLNVIIRNILLLFEFELKKNKAEVLFYPMEKLEALHVDDVQIQQILVNLVKNALDAISAAGQEEGRVEIRVQRRADEVLVEVSDNGPGVPPSLRSRLFEPFFTTKPKGVGLGLSICKSIAAAHGGTLRYDAPEAGGSRFTLALPAELIG